jgi:pimeloyl-ACP methyl ester carboxylesterase
MITSSIASPSASPHGARLHVVEHPGSDPAFVLLHGFPDDHHIYDRLAPLLAPRRVVAFDFFGYGHSGRISDDAHQTLAPREDLASVLDELDLERAVLVGHDAGGAVAVDYALAHPDRVEHLVFMDAFYGHAPQLRLPEMIRLLADPNFARLADAMIADPGQLLWLLNETGRRLTGRDDVPPDGIAATSILPQFFGNAEQPDALRAIRLWTGTLFADLDEQDARIAAGALAALDVPVLLVAGADDEYLGPDLVRHLATHFSRSTVEVIARASHWPQWDQPEVVAGHLLASHAITGASPRALEQ